MKYPAVSSARVAMFLVSIALLGAGVAYAQMAPMGMPINTTLVISKPAPDQIYGDKQLVTMGVGTKEYKFVLNDAYVDDASGRVRWPDIWQQVRIYRPNFVMQGPNVEDLADVKPGDMVTIKGMYAPLDRTFEVMFVQAGKGVYEPKKNY
ncbi:MAG: hypothetical protein ACLQAT_21445 [Candidatus Binataceae bacterium]